MGIGNNMTGTPWHVDRFAREEGDPKRHRSRCTYYDNKRSEAYRCEKLGRCSGSAHCMYYRELTQSQKRARADAEANKEKQKEKQGANYFERCRVRHKIFGEGTVTKVENGHIEVRFDSHIDARLNIETSEKHHLLVRLP